MTVPLGFFQMLAIARACKRAADDGHPVPDHVRRDEERFFCTAGHPDFRAQFEGDCPPAFDPDTLGKRS